MKIRLFAFLIFLAGLGTASAAEREWPAWPRAWTVNVSGEWTISGCPLPVHALRVVQEGSSLQSATPTLRGTVQGHDIEFTIADGDALNCLPTTGPLHFSGQADGARISGTLVSVNDPAIHAAISIRLHREFMLSFDDGPLPGKTNLVLDALKRLHASDGLPVRAAFFTVDVASRAWYAPYEIWRDKGNMQSHPDLIARILREGHALGNHTAHHAWFRWPRFQDPREIINELREWEAASPRLAQERLFRPPYLITNESVFAAANAARYAIVLGDTTGDATPGSNVDAIEWKILSTLETRDVASPTLLIFHDTLPVTANHLEAIVRRLLDAGYTLTHFDTTRLDAKTVIRPH